MAKPDISIVFMGTPDFAVPCLRVLIANGYQVAAVVTQPDRPKGRKRVLTPPPVKVEAEKHGIPVLQPERIKHEAAVQSILRYKPDLIVTAAYGQILPKVILDAPSYGCVNVHASLLPKYRGGAPIHYALLKGEPATGVTLMYMAEGLDTGDMISRVELPITDEDTTGTLHDKLSEAGSALLKETLPQLLAGTVQAIPQNDDEATYAPNITRDDERIDWSRLTRDIFNQIRGLNPWPGAFTTWEGQALKVWAARPPSESGQERGNEAIEAMEPGTVLTMSSTGIQIKTGTGSLWLKQIQPAGKRRMDVAEFARGSAISEGTVLGK